MGIISAEIFSLVGKIALDGAEEAEKKVESFSAKAGKGLQTAMKVGAVAVTAVATAIAGVTTAVVKGAKETATYGDNVDKMSQKIGISAKAYQEWDFIMGQCGMSVDQLQTGMKTLSNAVDSDSDAFERLGMNISEVKTMSTEDLFNKTITKLSEMEAGTERTAIAVDLFGKSATDLMPLLNTGAEGIEELRRQAEEYGLVMSDEAVKASADFNDSVTLMNKTMSGFKNRMTAEMLPALTQVTNGLGKLFKGDLSGLESINKGISEFASKLNEIIPKVLEVGASVIESLANAIIENLPTLIEAGVTIIGELAMSLLNMIPMIIDAGVQILLAIIDGITSDPNSLIETIIEIVTTIVTTLIDNIPLLLEAGLQLIVALVGALINNLPKVVEAGGSILKAIINGVKDLFGDLIELGGQVVDKIKEGIANAWEGIKQWFQNLWASLFGGLEVNVSASGLSGSTSSGTSGSHRAGMEYVPYDNYVAQLHQGEMVLTSAEAEAYRLSANNGTGDNSEILAEILQELKEQRKVGISINNREFGRLVKGVS